MNSFPRGLSRNDATDHVVMELTVTKDAPRSELDSLTSVPSKFAIGSLSVNATLLRKPPANWFRNNLGSELANNVAALAVPLRNIPETRMNVNLLAIRFKSFEDNPPESAMSNQLLVTR